MPETDIVRCYHNNCLSVRPLSEMYGIKDCKTEEIKYSCINHGVLIQVCNFHDSVPTIRILSAKEKIYYGWISYPTPTTKVRFKNKQGLISAFCEGSALECHSCHRGVKDSIFSFKEHADSKVSCDACFLILTGAIGESTLNPITALGYKFSRTDILGLELELQWNITDNRQDVLKEIYQTKKVLGKIDGSVSNGVEFVTVPLSLKEHRGLWKEICPQLEKNFRGSDKCGLHIHIPRQHMSSGSMYKLFRLVHNPENQEFFSYVGGRAPNTYCKLAEKSICKQHFIKNKAFVKNKDISVSQHYWALSISRHPTLEFRWFKSSPMQKPILSSLEFVSALRDYAPLGSFKDDNYKAFVNWFFREKKEEQYQNIGATLKGI